VTDSLPIGGASMAAEMADQPRALDSLLDYRRTMPAQPLSELQPPAGVLLIARGSSDHAATYGRYVLEAALGVPVSLCAPSLWTRYGRYARLDGYLAIGLSQSGQTPEIARVLELAGRAGATTLAITNDVDSPLADAAAFTLGLGVGPEHAVPATKSFLGQLLALAIVAETLGEAPWSAADPDRLPEAVQELLDDESAVAAAADMLAEARAVVQVGGGYLYAVAQEAALKMIETASFPVLAYSAADLIHGPVATAGVSVPVVCYSSQGPLEDDMRRVAAAASGRGASLVWVGEGDPPGAAHRLAVRPIIPEALMPLLHVVRAQQLALALSRAVGLDADQPTGLKKVTATS
jgi:glutamine---fructose-6-phosphate transaminase (isomerizing)